MTIGYDWLSLDAGEEVLWTGKPRIQSTLGTAAGAIGFALASLVAPGAAATVTDVPRWLLLIAGVVALYGGAQIAWAYVRVANTDCVLTTENLYEKRGVLSITIESVDLDGIQNTESRRSFLGQVFDRLEAVRIRVDRRQHGRERRYRSLVRSRRGRPVGSGDDHPGA